MIQSKADLQYYIESDLKALGCYPLNLKSKWGGTGTPNLEIPNQVKKDGISL